MLPKRGAKGKTFAFAAPRPLFSTMTRLPAHIRGAALLHEPRFNKGTAFSDAERDQLGLRGLLPPSHLSIEQQAARILEAFRSRSSPLDQYIYLTGLQDRNETLFYRALIDHLEEMTPVVYTPTVGEACLKFGHIYRRPRGLYVTDEDRGRVEQVLRNWSGSKVSMIVITDGERILGLGDLGAFGMGIPIGKLSLYAACAGVAPDECLPVMLDVGTENTALRNDPLYTGLPHTRIRGDAYLALVDEFVAAVQKVFPGAIIQFEDFATENAFGLLARYRDQVPCFNDDIQGTAAVTLAGLMATARVTGRSLADQRLLFLGAGSAATGIGELVASALVRDGLSPAEARTRCWFVDTKGLVVASRTDLAAHKRPFGHEHPPVVTLEGAVEALKPTALIGLAAQPGAFTESIIRTMAANHDRPVVFALSNPTSKAECTADQAYQWSSGRAIFASGSPFRPLDVQGRRFEPSQANNAYVFPGIGLGAILAGSRRITEDMFIAAARILAGSAPTEALANGSLFPRLGEIRRLSREIAEAVVRIAVKDGLASASVPADVGPWIDERIYRAEYPDYTAE